MGCSALLNRETCLSYITAKAARGGNQTEVLVFAGCGAVASLDCWGRFIGSGGVGDVFCHGVDGSGVNIGGVGYRDGDGSASVFVGCCSEQRWSASLLLQSCGRLTVLDSALALFFSRWKWI